MYNVEFGESVLLQDKNRFLLVDFGSLRNIPKLDSVARDISTQCRIAEQPLLDLLITHFHDDHIKGILKTNLFRFSRGGIGGGIVYMPDLVAMQNVTGLLNWIQVSVLIDVLTAISSRGSLNVTLMKLLNVLKDGSRTVRFLRRGESFDFAGTDYEVLWPDFKNLTVNGKTANHTKMLLNRLVVYPGDGPNDPNAITLWSEMGTIDRLCRTLVHAFEILPANSPDTDMALTRAFDAVQALVDAVIQNLPKGVTTADLTAHINSLIKQHNNISIVFHDKPVNGISKILMTGDIPSNHMNALIDSKDPPFLSREYTMITAPHHGTSTYFVQRLPKCDHILISNGDPSGRNYHKIHWGYGALYHSNRKYTTIHCTNTRCELLDTYPLNKICSNCLALVKPAGCNGCLADCQHPPVFNCKVYPRCQYIDCRIPAPKKP